LGHYTKIKTGNTKELGKNNRGWIIGPYKDDFLKTAPFEVKAILKKKGVCEETTVSNTNVSTMAILAYGKFKLTFNNKELFLENNGDYVFFNPCGHHSVIYLEDSYVITFRWKN